VLPGVGVEPLLRVDQQKPSDGRARLPRCTRAHVDLREEIGAGDRGGRFGASWLTSH